MQSRGIPTSLPAFASRFGGDFQCAEFLAELRWPGGFRCECGGLEAWHLRSRPRVYQCSGCRRHHSVTAGTVMHRSKVSLVEWFWAAWALGQDKRGVSALHLSRLLGRRYETVWRLLHKVRAALSEDSGAFPLDGVIEIDETYTGGKVSKGRGGRSLSDPRRALVALAVERKPVEAGNAGIRGSGVRCGSARMRVVESASAADLMAFVEASCAKGATVRTDGWSGYRSAGAAEFEHVRLVEGKPENAGELFPLVHTVFANLKAWVNGTFHGVSAIWLPAYIAEYTYRFNRRTYTHDGDLWRFLLRRLTRGAWRPWAERNADYETRRAA